MREKLEDALCPGHADRCLRPESGQDPFNETLELVKFKRESSNEKFLFFPSNYKTAWCRNGTQERILPSFYGFITKMGPHTELASISQDGVKFPPLKSDSS